MPCSQNLTDKVVVVSLGIFHIVDRADDGLQIFGRVVDENIAVDRRRAGRLLNK